jgi:uncharacterized membrane protein YraQ (UPF0718 family)
MNIVTGTVILMVLAAWVWRQLETTQRRQQALGGVWRMVMKNMPRLVVALISAGLFAELLPESIVRQYLGDTAGFYGVLLAAGLGIVTPGGAFVSFALAAGAMNAGAATAALIAYVTAWALLGLTRVMAEEMSFLGCRFTVIRMVLTAPLPLIAGGAALLFQ